MKLLMFTIRDIKGDSFNTPFFFSTQGQALRAFGDLANDKQSTIGQHPEDYVLYYIATFDMHSGDVSAEPQPKHLANGTDFINNPTAVPLQRVS